MKQLLIIFVTFICSGNLLFAQSNYHPDFPIVGKIESENLQFDHFTVSEGLASNAVYFIFQDSYGFIWFGTNNGLSRYDGYKFLNFQNSINDSLSISDNWITAIDEDIFGNLWISTKNGLNKYDRKNEIFIRYYLEPGNLNSLSHNHVRSIYCDDDGVLWIETVNSFLDKYDLKQDTFYHFRHEPYRRIVPLHYYNHPIYEANNNTLWLGTRNTGAYNFDKQKNRFIKHFISDGDSEWGENIYALSNTNVSSIFEERGHLWFGSSTSPLNIYDATTKIFHRYFELKDVYTICKVDENKIWMGTSSEGVFIYDLDKQALSKVQNNPDYHKSLIDNSVNYIYVDNAENIWIATKKGISKYNYQKDKFKRYQHIVGDENSISENNITALLEDNNGNIWAGTLRNGLNEIDRLTGNIKHYNKYNSNIGSNRVSCLYLDSKNDLYVGLMEGIGFTIYDFSTKKFTTYSYHKYSTRKDWYKGFLEDSYGNFWVALWGAKGFVKFNRNEKLFDFKAYFGNENNFKENFNSRIVVIDDQIFALYNTNYLYSYSTQTSEFKIYSDKDEIVRTAIEFDKNGMPNYGVNSIPYAYGNIIDIGDFIVKDIYKIDRKLLIFSENSIIIFDTQKQAILENIKQTYPYIFPALEENFIWLISDQKIVKFDWKNNHEIISYSVKNQFSDIEKAVNYKNENIIILADTKLYSYRFSKQTLEKIVNDSLITDFVVSNNMLYYAYSEGLKSFNLENEESAKLLLKEKININCLSVNKEILYAGTDIGVYLCNLQEVENRSWKKSSISDNQVFDMYIDEKNKMWLATDKGVEAFDLIEKKKTIYNKTDSTKLSTQLITYLFEDSNKQLWIGTSDKGVSIFNPSTEKFKHLEPIFNDTNTIHNSYVNFIYEDSENTIYVGNDVLNIYFPSQGKFQKIIPGNSWLPGKPMGMLEDENKNLWISTENGLCKYNLESQHYQVFYQEDGLPGNQFTKAHYKLNTGEMMFGGIDGFCLFHPDSLIESSFNPVINITRFDVFNKPAYTDFTQKDVIKLSYKQNFFTIYFAATDYTTPSKNEFKYILEGIDKEWVNAKNENKANYTNVSPGHYTFKVTGTNHDGLWTNNEEQLVIIIKPAFWQTNWFKFSVVVFILIGITYFFVQWYNRIRMMQKNAELEQRMLRSQMNPHFIFNSLTAIQYFIFGNDPGKAGKYLSGFAKLIRLILQNSRSEYILLEKEIETLEHYLKLQQLRFEDKFEYQISIDEELNPEMVLIPPMLAQPFIENSIEHGIKNISYTGEINVSYMLRNEMLEIRIEDNGIGIENSTAKMEDSKSVHKSLGTSITKERLINLSRTQKRKIQFEIIDKKNLDQNKSGTIVKYVLPLKYNL